MKKLGLLLLVFMASFIYVQAQVAIGIRAGGSLNRFAFPEGFLETNTYSPKIGYLGGLALEMPLGGRFAFQTEINYATRGSKFTEEFEENFLYDSAGVTRKAGIYKKRVIELSYLDIPLIFKYKFRGRPVGGHILVGLNFGTGLQNGQEKLSLQDGDNNDLSPQKAELIFQELETQKRDKDIRMSKNPDQNVDYLSGNSGLITGAGLSLDTDLLKFNLDLRYFLGTSSLFNISEKKSADNPFVWGQTDEFHIKNRSIQLSLTVFYPLGGGW
jgi:hypothetical protein